MATRLTHRQKPDLQSYTILALGRAFAVTGQAALTLAGRKLVVPDRIPYSYDGYAVTLTTGTGDVWNVTPAPTWTQGVSAPYDLTATLPSTYTDGGVYSFGYEGTTPPTGLTLSEAGSLDVGTATAATTTGVKFSYYEPGATTTLTLHSQFAGTYPYMATIYPLEGTVPSGQILLSPDDSTFRSSVLSTWPDGSAQVMVGAGRKAVSGGGTTNIKLRPGLASGTNMTTTDLVAVVNTVAVNFGTPLSLTLTNSNHDRIWWQNPEVICARYRLPITNKGSMEAVIDVHCFQGGRAFVEVVIENGRVNASAASVTAPAPQSYTGATVSVNGATIATVNSSHSYYPGGATTTQANHEAFRAWYCSTWIGGDPGIDVTHDTTSMQAHPAFYRVDKPSSTNFATTSFTVDSLCRGISSQPYGSDTYAPWATLRIPAYGMGAGGDAATIGGLTRWESFYLQTGDKYVRNAVIQNGLARLSFPFNFRDSTTNDVPTYVQLNGKTYSYGNWPRTTTEPDWEAAHQPSAGLMAFLCRPSPCFLELSQKITVWNATWTGNGHDAHLGITVSTGDYRNVFGYWNQTRGKAWAIRNLGQAVFTTPDSHGWKSSGKVFVDANRQVIDAFRNDAKATLGFVWDYCVDDVVDQTVSYAGYQYSLFLHHYLAVELHKIANCKLVATANQSAMSATADWAVTQATRWVNELPNGGWRYILYRDTLGTTGDTDAGGQWMGNNMGPFATYTAARAYRFADTPPSVGGTFFSSNEVDTSLINSYAACGASNTAGAYYPSYWWAVLCCAVERDVSGAETAWSTVTNATNGVTNLATWRNGFATEPRWGFYPRNK